MHLEPVGPTLADRPAPGGDLADFGEALRHYDAELARLTAAGVPIAATARLSAARRDLLADLAVIDAATPHTWLVVSDDPPAAALRALEQLPPAEVDEVPLDP